MARPPLPIGTWGEISVEGVDAPYRARCRYRDRDGITRRVERYGQTKGAARAALLAALSERQAQRGDNLIRSSMTIAQVIPLWRDSLEQQDRSPNTLRVYDQATKHVIREIGAVRVQEANTGVVEGALQRVRSGSGPSAAKTVRSVLNGVFSLAVRHGALDTSPVRETTPLPSKPAKGRPRALSAEEVIAITEGLRADERAVMLDLPDLVDMMLATGCRIGEALGMLGESVDLDAGTVEINATIVRLTGQGLIVQRRTKTAAGWRINALPAYAVAMLRRRTDELMFRAPEGTIFSSPLRPTLRDPSNCAGDLRERLDLLGFPWVTGHVFRKTVATRLEEAGATARQIADQLGHAKPSMTMDTYMGRKVTLSLAAEVLER